MALENPMSCRQVYEVAQIHCPQLLSTSDLIDLLNVIGRLVALEPRQAKLLDDILSTDLSDLDLINEALTDPSASTAASG